jgi:acyl-CoA synthetase (AMP-forming)/AMP-acid ligase II
MVRPAQPWSSHTVDPAALADGHWINQANGRELVASGTALPGMNFRIGGTGIGQIEVSGPSLMSGYVGDDQTRTGTGWFATGDLGAVIDGELVVTGRRDDLLVIAGRNHYAEDIEYLVNRVRGVRGTNSVALADDEHDDRYVVVAEAYPRANLTDLAHQMRASLIRHIGAGPSDITLTTPGSMPKTPSGKLARHRVRAQRADGRLAVAAHFDFRPKSPQDQHL